MKRRSLLLSLIAVATAAAVSGNAMAEDALSTILARKVIRVAVPTDYPPYGSVGTDMTPRGYDIDMATLVAKNSASNWN